MKTRPAYRFFLFLVIGILWITACHEKAENNSLPFFNHPDFTPEWIDSDSQEFDQIHRIADFEFVNQNGEKVNQQTFAGKIYVADFFFTSCPGICPKLTKRMQSLQEAFKDDDDLLLLSHTVTPWMDSIPRLRHYANVNKVLDDKWHLVTGDKEQIYTLARKSYFADEDIGFQKTSDDFLHTENFILIDKNRRIRGVYNGTQELEVKRLIEDIHVLKLEAH